MTRRSPASRAKSFTIQRFNPLEDFKDTDTIAAAQRRNKELTLEDYDYLQQRATLIGKIGARARGTPSEVKRGEEVLEDVFVSGATANCVDIENRDVAEGRFIAEPENESAARVAYIGADVADKLFPAGNPVGQEITIRGLPYRVIGVEVAKGTVFGMPQDTFIVIPLKTYSINYGGLIRQRSLYFVATSITDELFNDAVEESRFLMRARRKLGPNEKDNFGIVTPDAITGLRDRLFGTIFIVAIAVPGIALDRGRDRHHEHHAGVRHRTHQGDRHQKILRRAADGHHETVFGRSRGAGNYGRRGWDFSGLGRRLCRDGVDLSDLFVDRCDSGRTRGIRRRRRGFRNLSGLEGSETRSD